MNKGLEALQKIKSNLRLFGFDEDTDNFKLLDIIEKELKALEIIRNIGILKPYETSGGQCWLETMCDATKISKEVYDLLKEVLP